MPRTRRASQGGYCYHVLNRGNARHTMGDCVSFLELLHEAGERTPIRLLFYCLMPNHFHLAVWPRNDGDLRRGLALVEPGDDSRSLQAE